MQGSWSIKAVLPTLAPDLRYESLDGVKNGLQAQAAYLEAIYPRTSLERRDQIHDELIAYCKLDTLAMIAITRVLSSKQPIFPAQDIGATIALPPLLASPTDSMQRRN